MGIRKLTAADVEFTVTCEPEDIAIEGNALASGNDDEDRAAEQWIYDQLNSGNEWAWCTVRVAAIWKGFTGLAYLGACSYLSEADFTAPGGYYDDLKKEALDDINRQLEDVAELCQ